MWKTVDDISSSALEWHVEPLFTIQYSEHPIHHFIYVHGNSVDNIAHSLMDTPYDSKRLYYAAVEWLIVSVNCVFYEW